MRPSLVVLACFILLGCSTKEEAAGSGEKGDEAAVARTEESDAGAPESNRHIGETCQKPASCTEGLKCIEGVCQKLTDLKVACVELLERDTAGRWSTLAACEDEQRNTLDGCSEDFAVAAAAFRACVEGGQTDEECRTRACPTPQRLVCDHLAKNSGLGTMTPESCQTQVADLLKECGAAGVFGPQLVECMLSKSTEAEAAQCASDICLSEAAKQTHIDAAIEERSANAPPPPDPEVEAAAREAVSKWKSSKSIDVDTGTMKVLKARHAKKWVVDRVSRRRSELKADKDSEMFVVDFTFTSSDKNPKLPLLVVIASGEKGEPTTIGYMPTRFYKWSDYGAYLGNHHDSKHDFRKHDTVKFTAGTQIKILSEYGSTTFTVGESGSWEKRQYFEGATYGVPFTVTVKVNGDVHTTYQFTVNEPEGEG